MGGAILRLLLRAASPLWAADQGVCFSCFGVVVAVGGARGLSCYWFQPSGSMLGGDRPEQQGHDITVVILLHFFDLTVGTLRFDLANQTAGAMPIVGGKWFPAVDGHAAQRTVTVAEGLVSLRFADDLLVRFADASQFEFVENVGHHVGAEGLHLRSGLAPNELLKIALLQIPFQG